MKKFKSLCFVVLCVALLGIGRTGHGATYSLVDDWSDSSNPNGVWTYREGTTALPGVSDWTWLGAGAPQPAWAPSVAAGDYLPAWFKSTTDNPGGLDFLTGDVVVHTTDDANGSLHGLANLLWTSPTNGVVDISGAVWKARDGNGRGNIWRIIVDGIAVTSGAVGSGDSSTRATPFDLASGSGGLVALTAIAIAAGETIVLEFEKSSTLGDFVGVDFNIDLTPSPVPVPAALPLFVSAVAGAGFFGWRKSRSPVRHA